MTPSQVARHLAERGVWRSSRSSGPGGQRRDHAETRVELVVDAACTEGLPDAVAQRVRDGLRLAERALRLRCGTQRSREQNRVIVEGRLLARVTAALAPPAPARRPSRPTSGSRERRLAQKRRRAAVKDARQPPGPHD